MKKMCKLLLAVLLVVFSGHNAYCLELIYPEDGTLLEKQGNLIIKAGGNNAVDGVIVEINGFRSGLLDISSPEYKAVFQDFLILEPEYSSGKNVIVVEGYKQGAVVGKLSTEIYFQANPNVFPPPKYRPFVMHVSQKEALCSSCHEMSPTMEDLRNYSSANPCAACHKNLLNKKYVHGPAGVYQCVSCHDPSTRPSKYKVKNSDVWLCAECHSDKISKFKANSFIHGPVEVGMCLVCHNAHSSENPYQLKASVNDLCLGCHSGLQVPVHFTQGTGKGHPVSGAVDPRSPINEKLSCVSCHNPHGGVNRVFFEKDLSGMMFCQECHKK